MTLPNPAADPPGKTVAMTILQQLGGNRFARMTGASRFISTPTSLSFAIPRARSIRRVKITLLADDTYLMEFFSIYRYDARLLKDFHGVYADDLQRIFTEVTGLHTHF